MNYEQVKAIVLKTGKVGFDGAYNSPDGLNKWLGIWTLGLVGELGELLNEIKNGDGISPENITEELADICWYTTAIDILLGKNEVEKMIMLPPNVYTFSCLEATAIDSLLAGLRFSEKVKKYIRDYPERSIDSIEGYTYPISHLNGAMDFSKVGEILTEKLSKRYPNGFSPKDSVNRTK